MEIKHALLMDNFFGMQYHSCICRYVLAEQKTSKQTGLGVSNFRTSNLLMDNYFGMQCSASESTSTLQLLHSIKKKNSRNTETIFHTMTILNDFLGAGM